MGEERNASLLSLEVKGPFDGSNDSQPPDGVPAKIVSTEVGRGVGAQSWVNLLIEINLPALVSGVGINVISQWLYDKFKDRGRVSAREPANRIEIRVEGRGTTIISLTDQGAVERALREVIDAAERDRSTEDD